MLKCFDVLSDTWDKGYVIWYLKQNELEQWESVKYWWLDMASHGKNLFLLFVVVIVKALLLLL